MGSTANGGGGGGGRAARVLRALLLLVLLLAFVEYMFGSILDASSTIRTYLYTPPNSTDRSSDRVSSWPKHLPIAQTATPIPETNITLLGLLRNHSDILNPRSDNSSSLKTVSTKAAELAMTTQLITKMVESIRNLETTERSVNSSNASSYSSKRNDTDLPLCDELPPDLGPIPVDKKDMELEDVENKYPEVYWGGRYSPPNCIPRYKVAIIVPYRDREQHLAIFLNHMHPFLMKQQLDYGIYVVEQEGSRDFNRAKLMNVGFRESMRLTANSWQCFIFHDIDLLPLDGRNMYSCPRQPRHMSVSIDKLDFKLPYVEIFGGVSALTYEQFTKVNGFSNKYWGWGGEDDDMFYRLKKMNYHVARYKMSIARYSMLNHRKSSPNPKRYQLLSQTTKQFMKDGLTTLKYNVIEVNKKHLFTHMLVNIDQLS